MKKLITVSILLSSLLMLGNAVATTQGEAIKHVAAQGISTKTSTKAIALASTNIGYPATLQSSDE